MLLRRRRVTGRISAALGGGAVASGATTVAAMAAGAPEWLGLLGGGATTVAAIPAFVALAHWRRLRRAPLPEARPVPTRRPDPWSSAREPLHRLGTAERSLGELTALLGQSEWVPEDELEQVRAAAQVAAQALRSDAAKLGALERVAHWSVSAAHELSAPLLAARRRLDEGVAVYEALVGSAARVVRLVDAGRSIELDDPTDRLEGLESALTELAELHSGSSPFRRSR